MNTIEYIKASLEISMGATLPLILDLKSQPLVQPTQNGGNHAHWILGHLVYTESSVIHKLMLGKDSCPLDHLKPLFDMGTQPCPEGTNYPAYEELLAQLEEARAFTLSTLETLNDDDLDKPAPGCPEEWSAWFGTIGKVFNTQVIHPMMHYGQLTDIRKALGLDPLFA